MVEVFLSLGSNIGEREEYLRFAVAELARVGVEVLNVSGIYETAPWGGVEQEAFLNITLRGKTDLSEEELLDRLQGIEAAAKRERKVRWGPRTLDIDILLYGREIINTERLIVPHKELQNRGFVLLPWAEIAPTVTVPGLGKTVWQLVCELPLAEKQGVCLKGGLKLRNGQNFNKFWN